MTKSFVRFYYVCFLFVVLILPYGLFNRQLPSPVYIWLLGPLPTTWPHIYIGFGLFVGSTVFSLLAVVKESQFVRALAFFSFSLLLCYKFSFGKIDHLFHIWVYSSFFVTFIETSKSLVSNRNLLLIRLTQTCLLMQYFSSGLWKLRVNLTELSFRFLIESGVEHLAHGVVERNLPVHQLQASLISEEGRWLLGLGFLAAVLFQIFCGICGLLQRGYLVCGLLAMIFHISAGISIGVWYWGTLCAALFFLVFAEVLIRDCQLSTGPRADS